tara:strand:- start:886 stop:1173 length:288 start_codon:yes stop_codon:yes gene_type:complete
MKVALKNIKMQLNAKQCCNFYIKRLRRLRNGEEVYYTEDYLKDLIRIYYYESKMDLLYLPNETIKVSSISDLMYYESLFGKSIYEKRKNKNGDKK